MLFFCSRLRSVSLVTVSLLALSACSEVEHVANRGYNSVSSAASSLFESDAPVKSSPTQVEVSTPIAAPYQDVKTADAPVVASAVELGSMRDDSLPKTDSAMPERIKPVAAAASAAPAVPIIEQTAVAVPLENLGAPLMIIRFNQTNVYYDDSLAKVVKVAETNRPGVKYNVVSALPDLSALSAEQQQDISKRAMDNLRDVVTQMQQLGVSADRVKIAAQKKPVRAQEISIYVN